MDINVIKRYEGQRIKVILKSGNFYTGRIKNIINTTIIFLDKYNEEVPFDADAVNEIKTLPPTPPKDEVKNGSE